MIEKLQVMQSAENENYNVHVAARQRIAEGYQSAAGLYGQGAGMAMQGFSAALNAAGAIGQAGAVVAQRVSGPSGLALALTVAGQAAMGAGQVADKWPSATETVRTPQLPA